VSAGTGLTQDASGLSLTAITAGVATVGAVRYNGTTKTAGQFDGSTTTPTNTTRLNYDGYLYATRFYGDGSQLTNVAATDSTKLPLAGGTMTGLLATVGNTAAFTSANDTTLSVRSSGTGTAASMSFHRPGAYAVNFGLDTDNVMKLGGWSASSVRHSWDMSGNYTATGDVNTTSDERLKTNWRSISSTLLDDLTSVKCGIYDRTDNGLTQAGVSAQDMQAVLPEVVREDSEGILSLNYGNAALVAVIELTKLVKEQQKQIDDLRAQINSRLY
jgi:hypothetical protein